MLPVQGAPSTLCPGEPYLHSGQVPAMTGHGAGRRVLEPSWGWQELRSRGFSAGKFPLAGNKGKLPPPQQCGFNPSREVTGPQGANPRGRPGCCGNEPRAVPLAVTHRPPCPGGAGGWCPRAPAQRCTGGRQWRPTAGRWWRRQRRRDRLQRAARAARSRGWGPGPAGTLLEDKHPRAWGAWSGY